MTITTATTPCFIDFRPGAGRPSLAGKQTRAERLDSETSFVETLRTYTTALARHCHHDTPSVYADFVNDLTETDPDDAPSADTARLAHLLHTYADYLPSPDCTFSDMDPWEYHAWESPDGLVVVDVITTLTRTELDAHADLYRVEEAAQNAHLSWGSLFAGVRQIVLDAPYESTWHPAAGPSEPLLTSALNSVATETGGFR